MPPPSGEQITVALEAMRSDAAVWDNAADGLTEAARVAARLDLSALHFSYLGDVVGLTGVYRELQDKLCRLLTEGAHNLSGLAQALRSAANGYEEEEQENIHHIRDVY